MKKIIGLLVIISCISSSANLAFADEELSTAELSENYIDYINMPEEEREGYIPPPMTDVVKPKAGLRLMAATYPSSLDGRDKSYIMPVRNQMQTGTCWAFSTLTNTSVLLKKNTGNEYTFSPRHMENAMAQNPNDLSNPIGYNRNVDSGGNSLYAGAYFSRGSGPVYESDYPFKNTKNPEATAKNYQPVSFWVKDYELISNSNGTYENAVNDIKRMVTNYGSAVISYYMEEKNLSAYYNSPRASYYYSSSGTVNPNHAVLIVGWDDNYSKDNFVNEPSRDGAWIVQNSWGSSWGEKGFFYMSYDEKEIYEYPISTARNIGDVSYDNAYIYDFLGRVVAYNYRESKVIYAANVFKKQPGTEQLKYVTLFNDGATSYTIYVNPNGKVKSIGQMQQVASGSIDFSGYKTVELSTPVNLTGSEFTVAVKYSVTSGVAYAAAEIAVNDARYLNVKIDGSSYLSSSGTRWEEMSDTDFCIKAFTKDVTPKTKVDFVKSNSNSLVYMTSSDGDKMIPKMDGTYSLTNDDYNFEIALYNKSSVTGKFKINGESSRTLYAQSEPVSMNSAVEEFDELLRTFRQTDSAADINDRLGESVGSTYRIDDNNAFTVTPPTATLNGRLNGTVTLYDTFYNRSQSLTYNNDTVFKTQLIKTPSSVFIRANSDTEGKLYVAEYKNGALEAVKLHDIDLNEGELTVINTNSGDIKIFFWDDGRMYPYAKEVE